MTGLNEVSFWVAFSASLAMYFASSFLKVNLGGCYPSDCIFSIFAIGIIYGIHFTILVIDLGINTCEVCNRNQFCYYEEN